MFVYLTLGFTTSQGLAVFPFLLNHIRHGILDISIYNTAYTRAQAVNATVAAEQTLEIKRGNRKRRKFTQTAVRLRARSRFLIHLQWRKSRDLRLSLSLSLSLSSSLCRAIYR